MNVSVLVPSFNHEAHVVECLESILKNRIPEMEVIICDDASSDNSVSIIEQWIQKHGDSFDSIHFYHHKINQGITATLNEMISMSKGSLISLIASDDYFLDGAISTRFNFMENNPSLLGGFSDGIGIGDRNIPSLLSGSPMKRELILGDKIAEEVIFNWCEPANLQFWKRTAFKIHGGDFSFDNNIYAEDLDFALYAMSKNRFGYLDAPCVAYRYRSSSALKNEDYRSKWMDMAFMFGNHANNFTGITQDHMLARADYYYALAIKRHDKIQAAEKRFKQTLISYQSSRNKTEKSWFGLIKRK